MVAWNCPNCNDTVVVVVWFGVVFLTDNNTTPSKVVLSRFELLVGFWQFIWRYSGVSKLGLHKVRYPGNGVTIQTQIWLPFPGWVFSSIGQIKQ
jgi:hypothetical protein